MRDFQVPDAGRRLRVRLELEGGLNHALYTVRPFMYFHFAAGTRRVVVDGVEPMDSPADSIQFYLFDELYRKSSTATPRRSGWRSACRCGSIASSSTPTATTTPRITTLLLVTTEETRLEDLIARKVATGDIGATANTIVVMGSERVGNRLGRMLCVVKHRGSAMSDEIVEYRIGAQGLEIPGR